ncbi:MAG: aminotransferase class III-fold pyridoxal phosphate-dependent enzyme [Patescibacteria group bacterium]
MFEQRFEHDWFQRIRHRSQEEVLQISKEYSITSTIVDYSFVPWKAKKDFIWGKNGKQYIDFHSGVGCNNLGHANSQIFKAISRQLYGFGIINVPANDYPSPLATDLSEVLCGITPGKFPKKVFLSNSGTEAVEAAIKMCFKHNLKRKKFFSFQGAFHGRTLGALALTSSKPIQKQDFPNALGDGNVHHLPFPEQNNGLPFFDWNFYFKKNGIDLETFNAIFIELVQGEGGINVADRKNLTNLIKLLRENGVSIVIDEVQTGIMRTGRMFACYHYGIEPDIICLGKGLGSGMPIGATVAKAEYDFSERGCLSNTFGGNAIAAVAALETIKIFNSWHTGDYKKLEEKIKMLSDFSDSGLGMMRRIVCDSQEERNEIINRAYDKGLILLGAGEKNIRLMPPIIISKESLKEASKILESCY